MQHNKNKHIKLSTPLQVEDLDIAHPLPSNKGTPIIVKFLRRTQRNEIFSKKKILKGTKIILTESLTKRRLQFLEKTRQAFDRCPVWSWKGDIYVFYNSKKVKINDFSDIPELLTSYAQVAKK